MQFFKNVNFFRFFASSLWQQGCFCTKSPREVPFGSDTSLKSELGYQCLIRWLIDQYGQFQNRRRKIHVFSRNVLLDMVFLNFASQARSSIYKYWNVIFKTQSKMAARNDQENVQNFTFSCKYFRSTCFIMYENPHDRCHLVQRQPLSENHMISAWCAE